MKLSLAPCRAPLAVLAAALLFAACDSTDSDPPASIQRVGTGTPTAAVGTTLPDSLAVVVLDADGDPVRRALVTWTVTAGGGSVSPATSRTDRNGVAKTAWTLGTTAGQQRVTATVGDLAPVEFTATATASGLVRAVISPDSARLFTLGRTAQFTGVGYDQFNNVGVDATLRFVSLDTAVATVTPAGLVTAQGNGTTRIVFIAGTGADTALVRVRQIPREVRFNPNLDTIAVGDTVRATAYDSAGFAIPDAQWSRSAPAVVSVTTTGLVRGESPGSSLVTATAGGVAVSRAVVVVASQPLTAVALSAGQEHVCAVRSSGQVYCWGKNYDGQLGAGLPISGNENFQLARPVRVNTNVAFDTVAAGGSHTCALTAAGQAYCWGNNFTGQLGAASTDGCLYDFPCARTPIAVQGGLTFQEISAGGGNRRTANPTPGHTCALTTAGQAYCWGTNGSGQLGDGTTTQRSQPTAVAGGLTFTAIDAGVNHTCALTAAGAVYCWGYLASMGLGGAVTTPTQVSGALAFRQVSAGLFTTCGVSTTGQGYCWGDGTAGKLGNGSGGGSATSPTLVSGGHSWRNLEVGEYTVCGLTTTGQTYCWGIVATTGLANSVRTTPTLVSGPTFTQMSSSGGLLIDLGTDQEWWPSTTCGIAAQGRVWCRGNNHFGQVANGTFTPLVDPFTEVLLVQ